MTFSRPKPIQFNCMLLFTLLETKCQHFVWFRMKNTNTFNCSRAYALHFEKLKNILPFSLNRLFFADIGHFWIFPIPFERWVPYFSLTSQQFLLKQNQKQVLHLKYIEILIKNKRINTFSFIIKDVLVYN